MNKLFFTLVVTIALILCAGSFYIGFLVGNYVDQNLSKNPTDDSKTYSVEKIDGIVYSIENKELVILTGPDQTISQLPIWLADNVNISVIKRNSTTTEPGSIDEIQAGKKITVFAKKMTDGSLEATAIIIE